MVKEFNQNDLRIANGNLYGLPISADPELIIIPIPWEVTTSYRPGTASGPEEILAASLQVDLYEPNLKKAWKKGIVMQKVTPKIFSLNNIFRPKATKCIKYLEKGGEPGDKKVKNLYQKINAAGKTLNIWVEQETLKLLKQGKRVGILGGDHSVPLGLMRALAKIYPRYSVLHLDAHADLRRAYEGFKFSHASIMYNALKISSIKKLVQAGIRDYSQEEADYIVDSGRIVAFPDRQSKEKLFVGATWQQVCQSIIEPLGKNVYLSFDIDALEPALCPNTGTPVAGGFEYEQALYLIEILVRSGRKIIGFDLCEVAGGTTNQYDASVGARLLWRIINYVLWSHAG